MKGQNVCIGYEWVKEKEIQIKGTENILTKITHENFPNLKKIKVSIK